MTWVQWIVPALCSLALAAFLLSTFGARLWGDAAQMLVSKLETGRVDDTACPSRYHSKELEGLPAPVQRFFRAVLKEGQPTITAASVDLAGTFNMSSVGERWKPFKSRQRVITHRPGFVGDARVAIMPGVPVRVVDSDVAGEGLLRAAVLGWFTVANVRGGSEIARGEFMRYFAESAWYPTALLPSQGVRWEAVDNGSAKATIFDGLLSLTLLFRFDESGLISSFLADERAAMIGRKEVMLPWEGRWSDYRTYNGTLVPFTGEVAWLRPDGRKLYFVGAVTAVTHEYAP